MCFHALSLEDLEHIWLMAASDADRAKAARRALHFSPMRQWLRPPHDDPGSRYQNEPVSVAGIIVDFANIG